MRTLSKLGLVVGMSLAAPWAGAQPSPGEPPSSTPTPSTATVAPPEAPPPSSAPPAPTPASVAPPAWQTSDIGWLKRYTLARERLLAGDFARARDLFAELVATATTGVDRAVAQELELLARDWTSRELVVVRRDDLGESGASAKAAGEPTSDEMGVLYTNAVLYGLGTGAWVAVQTEPETAAAGILPALGLAGAAAGAVAIADSKKLFRYGVPQSIASGMYIGLEEGLVLTLWSQARVYRADEWTPKEVASAIWGFTTAGAAAGAIVGSLGGATPGRASFVGSAAMWSGLVSGLMVGAITPDDDTQDDSALLAAAVGLNAGAIAGVLTAGPVSPSIARVRFLDLGGIAGGVAVGGLYLSAAGKESTAGGLMGLLSIGIAGGLTTAWFATSTMGADRLSEENRPSPSTSSSVLTTATVSVAPTAGGAALAVRGMF